MRRFARMLELFLSLFPYYNPRAKSQHLVLIEISQSACRPPTRNVQTATQPFHAHWAVTSTQRCTSCFNHASLHQFDCPNSILIVMVRSDGPGEALMRKSMSCRICSLFEWTGWTLVSESAWYIGLILFIFSIFVWPLALFVWPALLLFAALEALRVASCHSCSIGF